MLKKLTATGILAGAAASAVLLAGPADAAGPATVVDIPAACYYSVPGYVPPAWCANYTQNPYYTPPTTYVPVPGYGWDRWHHGGWGGHHHWHH